MNNLVLRPEHDFIENYEYLKDLVNRINSTEVSIENRDLLQEIVLADYYVNKLIRQGSKIDTLEKISTVLQGVLDTVSSKDILSLSNNLELKTIKRKNYLYYFIKIVLLFVLSLLFIYYLVPFLINTIFGSLSDFLESFVSTLRGL